LCHNLTIADFSPTANAKTAIELQSAFEKRIVFDSDYTASQITNIADGTIIEGNNHTLKLADNTENVFFYLISKKNITFKDLNIDGNMTNNHGSIISSSIFTLGGCENVKFSNVSIKKCFRIAYSIAQCNNVSMENIVIDSCGYNAGNGFYAYGIEVNGGTNFVGNNIDIKNIYGFGLHFIDDQRSNLTNCKISNITRSFSIGITIS